ncbi:TAXI family TRAP transporter solute-binding subunit [Oceanobacillus saliphilus]|uniref:TAXI family TRAP transporter solute-binding subunit n=1 Tax=Oceanobacillus saliphilus TaxID=2925834 RepID=UPI00201D8049|nr:TAXI family TRAP transporter solute-binding subunit [Oceanobacillus saliphilus]
MKTSFKKLWKIAILIGLALIITACGSNNANEGNDETSSGNTELNFPTASTTGTIYPLGAAMANIWNNEVDGIRVNAQGSNGGVENLNLLKEGEGQITFATAGIVWEAYNGERGFKDRAYEDVRVMAGLYYNPNQFVIREDSGVETVADLEGRRFAPGAIGSTPEVESSIILPAYGIAYPDGIKENFIGFTEAIDLMRNNQIDGALIQAGVPTAAVTEMTATAGGKLIGIEDEVRKSLIDEYPWYSDVTIPAGTYDNQDEDINTLGIKMLLLVDASLDDDQVYEMTQVFWDNLEQLEETHPIVEQIDINEATVDLSGIPLHEGAKRYYEEEDVLVEE